MTLRYYDILETTLRDLDKWGDDPNQSKQDVLDAMRERIVQLMRHVITTPLIGTAYAYPGDIDLSELIAVMQAPT